jgi:hypothetical protein
MTSANEDIEDLKKQVTLLRADVEALAVANRNRRKNVCELIDMVEGIYERLNNVEHFIFPNLPSDINAVDRIVPLSPSGPEQEKKKP